MKPTDAYPGRVFEWTDSDYWRTVGFTTVYVALTCWSSHELKILVLDTNYPYHSVAEIIILRPNDSLWKKAKRIA